MQFCFLSSPAVVPADSAGSIGLLTFDQKNRADGAEANDAPTLLLGWTSNLRSEDNKVGASFASAPEARFF